MKHLILILTIAAVMPLTACTGSNNKTAAVAATSESDSEELDLTFLKNLGVDVTNITDVTAREVNIDAPTLTVEQKKTLLPMLARQGEEELINDSHIRGAHALPGGFTMLLVSTETGDDATCELLAVYDRDGHLTDYMQLGDCEAFLPHDFDDDFTHGTAEAQTTELNFIAPGELDIVRTAKEGSWKRNDEGSYGELTDLKWQVQTATLYTIDDKGHIAVTKQRELKREGNVPEDYDTSLDDLYMMPMSDATRIDRLDKVITDHVAKFTPEEAAESEDGIMVVQEYLLGNPTALLTWVYDHRDSDNVITTRLRQLFTDPWLEKSVLNNAINELTDDAARDYLRNLTAGWNPQ